MKITFITSGSIDSFAPTKRPFYFGRKLIEKGYDIDLIVSRSSEDVKKYGKSYDGMKIKYSNILSRFSNSYFDDCDIIHCVTPAILSATPSLFSTKLKKNHLVFEVDEWVKLVTPHHKKFLIQILDKLSAKYANRIIVCSDLLKTIYSQYSDKIEYMPYGVDLDYFDETKKGFEELRSNFNSEYIVVYTGWLLHHFDIDLVIKCANKVIKEEPDTNFVIVGTGEAQNMLKKLAQKLGIADKVIFTGFVQKEDLAKYQAMADILVFPLRNTLINLARCPTKTSEYMASGNLIVSNPIGEVKKALDGCGMFFDFGDVDDFAEKVLIGLHDKTLRKKYGSMARERAEKVYDLKVLLKQLIKIYDDL